MRNYTFTDKPCAAAGLTSYRYKGHWGFVMIGARDDADALIQAQRSLCDSVAVIGNLERWNGAAYAPIVSPVAAPVVLS